MNIQARVAFVPPVYIRSVMDCLNSLGVRPSVVLSNAGLAWEDLWDGQHMTDFEVFRRFVTYAIQCSGEPDLGLIAGSMLQPYHTPVGIGAVTSEDLGQGLRFLTRHAKLIFGCLEFKLESGPSTSTLTVSPTVPLCETHVFVMQTVVGAHCRLLEAILGRPADELAVGLPHPRPAGNELACRRYVREVSFDQDYLSLQLPVELLHSPSTAANAKAFLEAAQLCQKMEAELVHGAFVQGVRRALLERLTANPDGGELALALGISARTLVRRLAACGLTYSGMKDEVRKSLAVWYLRNTEMSIEGIALQLGYADPTNFARKFKDWYQVAPRRMRQALRVVSP